MKVAVFGAGTMGSGIAQVFAAHGHTTLMYASSVYLTVATPVTFCKASSLNPLHASGILFLFSKLPSSFGTE